jgi:hypothetical protein
MRDFSLSDALKQARQTRSQPLGDLFEVHKGNVADASLYAAVVGPVQATPLRRFLLIDSLLLADATNGAAKTDANIDGHSLT